MSHSELELHSRFHAYQFQLFGCKGALQCCLRFDLCHPKANGRIFTNFLEAYDQQLNSPEHKEAQKKSEKRDRQHVRLSQQIFQIRRKLKQGEVNAFVFVDLKKCVFACAASALQSVCC